MLCRTAKVRPANTYFGTEEIFLSFCRMNKMLLQAFSSPPPMGVRMAALVDGSMAIFVELPGPTT